MPSIVNATTTAGVAIQGDNSGVLALQTNNGTTAVTIDTSQNVGIGTASPSTKLELNTASSYGGLRIKGTSSASNGFEMALSSDGVTGNFWLYENSAMRFATNSTERMRISSAGNVGIGTTTPQRKLSVVGTDGASGQTEGNSRTSLFLDNNGANYLTIMTSTSGDGGVFFSDNGSNNGGMVYETSSDALYFRANNAERMRIASDGNIAVGSTGTSGSRFTILQPNSLNTQYLVNSNASTCYGMQIYYSARTPNNTGEEFIYCGDTAQRFSARSNGGLANFSGNNVNISDEREKTNIELAGNYLSKICSIPVKTFNYIDQNREEDDGLTLGVIAQDVQAIAPELVMESNWAGRDEPEKMRLGIYQTDLQYALMKAIQELNAKVEAQAAEIAALKGVK